MKGSKDILLISPNAKGLNDKIAYPPLGLLYIASNMNRKWKPSVRVMIDDNFNDFDYEFYGVSVHSVSTVKESQRLIDLILKHNKSAFIFVGGSGAGLIKKKPNVVVIKGEGEKYFGADTSNLDNLNFPARELLPHSYIRYTGPVHHSTIPSTTMIATRGCAYNCSFCDRVTHGRKFRKRSVDNIIKEVKHLKRKYGIGHIRFIDDCITLDRRWFIDLCDAMKDMYVTWTCLSRADLLDDKVLMYMKQARCQEIFFGFESGSQKMLDLMNKRITVKQNRDVIGKCREAGIKSCAYMMFGFPGEDEKTVDETIEFLETAKPDKSRISTFVPIPGTDVWDNPSKYGVKIKDNYEDYWYFDKKDFALEYPKDISGLRDKIMDYYDLNYKEEWTNANCA